MLPMELGVSAEIEIFGLAVTAGVFLGVIYGLFAIVRSALKLKAVCFVCDFVYALMFGAVFFVFSLAQTDYVRGFVLAGMVAGAAMWHFAIGRFLVRLFGVFLDALYRKTVSPVIDFIHKTVRKIGGAFVKNCSNFEK